MVMGFEADGESTSQMVPGAGVMIETADGGLDAGDLVGASMFGLVFRSTHRMVTRELSEEELGEFLDDDMRERLEREDVTVTKTEMKPRAKSVLTLLPWSEVKRVELAEEFIADTTLGDFLEDLEMTEGVEAVFNVDETLGEVIAGSDEEDDDEDDDES